MALILLIAPKSAEAIKIITTLDFSEPQAFLLSGLALAKLANGITNDKIGVKPQLEQ